MQEVVRPKARRPAAVEFRIRIVTAIDEFLVSGNRRDWLIAQASDQFHLVIDEAYEVSIVRRAPVTGAAVLYFVPLAALGLDPWAIELGGGVKDVALDVAAQAVVRAVHRPEWWVP
jgi:hypothetical protein